MVKGKRKEGRKSELVQDSKLLSFNQFKCLDQLVNY